jgi:hypothetical protein
VLDNSGGVPLYAMLYARDSAKFLGDVQRSVTSSVNGLCDGLNAKYWKMVQNSIFSCLLGTSSDAWKYDKNFLICEYLNASETLWRYTPLFPAVLAVYRDYLWDDLMIFVGNEEKSLLNICRSPDTTNDTRDRIFKTIVICRCHVYGIEIQMDNNKVAVGPGSIRFKENLLPKLTAFSPDGIQIPSNPNFPAIDLVWKQGSSMFGIQVHVSSHNDVVSSFCGMCREAKWFQNFDKIYLLYLSPEIGVTNLVSSIVNPIIFQGKRTRDETVQPRIFLNAVSKDLVSCLKDLQWPNGCCL